MTGKITGPLREQSDWEQQDENRLGFIKNKPFYDNRTTENIVIPVTFPSVAERVVINIAEVAEGYCALNHISDFVPSYDEFLNGVYYMDATGTEMKISDSNPALIEEGQVTWYRCDAAVLVVAKNTYNTVLLPEGLYEYLPCDSEGNINEQILANVQAYGVGHVSFPHETGELKTLDPKFLPSGSISATPDFAQNDPAAADYIKNRPFYEETDRIELLTDFTIDKYGDYVMDVPSFVLIPNQAYDIIWNGTLYENVVCRGASHSQGISVFDTEGNELCIYRLNGDNLVRIGNHSDKPCTVSLSTTGTVVHKIDQKYLPFYETEPVYDVVISEKTFYDEDYVTNEDGSVVVSTPFERLGYESAGDLNEMWFVVTLDGIEYNVQFK